MMAPAAAAAPRRAPAPSELRPSVIGRQGMLRGLDPAAYHLLAYHGDWTVAANLRFVRGAVARAKRGARVLWAVHAQDLADLLEGRPPEFSTSAAAADRVFRRCYTLEEARQLLRAGLRCYHRPSAAGALERLAFRMPRAALPLGVAPPAAPGADEEDVTARVAAYVGFAAPPAAAPGAPRRVLRRAESCAA